MKKVLLSTSALLLLAGACTPDKPNGSNTGNTPINNPEKAFTVDVDPSTFEITAIHDGKEETISKAREAEAVENFEETNKLISWTYPESELEIEIHQEDKFIDVSITSLAGEGIENEVSFPYVAGEQLILPIGEGKRIPKDDQDWKTHLDHEMDMNDSFTMPLYGSEKDDYSILYLPENTFNNTIAYDTEDDIEFNITHEYPTINDNKTYNTRIYVAENDPVDWATIYKNELLESDNFTTLAEKAKYVPDIEKLYGAPHIYFWNDQYLDDHSVDWKKLKKKVDDPIFAWVATLIDEHSEDSGDEFIQVLESLNDEEYVTPFQKTAILNGLNFAIQLEEFYDAAVFPDGKAPNDNQNEQERYATNKSLLASVLKEAVSPVEDWGKETSTEVLKDMKKEGIDRAWVGLPNWVNGLMQPDMVKYAEDAGYLVAPYDSYHSIHETPDISWNTATFKDPALFEEATITKKDGEHVTGFLGRGRKLNPTLSLPSVKDRVEGVLAGGIQFNSWFMDTDATGEIYDDYSPTHLTTQEEDWTARLERMEYLAKEHGLVVGAEGGNDFASEVIAFAHGIETPVIKWGDPDMRENADSEYFVGNYYSPTGGIPERYSKAVPIKEEYKAIYTDPTYSIPLYKLVYNDSVITTHQWEWDSLKIEGLETERKINEYLYNIPPMYHLDANSWEDKKETITTNYQTWSAFHEEAVQQPMTDFRVLSDDRLVQSTTYGESLTVIANFSDQDFQDDDRTIRANSAVIIDGNHEVKIE
ncbi:glycoside hydrolase [Jeotgalibacillus marinus]|uniref:Glycoside hydrolase n=1 Tax=Jeotgalibacillus marinus TaxID=86667 RepID=A0ABV3PYZ6_9BACL